MNENDGRIVLDIFQKKMMFYLNRMDMMTFKELLKLFVFTQTDLAKECGLSISYISQSAN